MENILSLRGLSPEAGRQNFEKLGIEKTMRLGNLAIKRDEMLGINDPLTHLYQYLERGEAAVTGIREDLETDVAERLPKTPFINHVGFEFIDNDFVSVKDKVSMDSMTQSNLRVLRTEASVHSELSEELLRAEIEAQEVTKLTNWFERARTGSYIIFESLPIGNQKIAISRIYQKQSVSRLEGCFVSLYNPEVNQFNKFRREFDSRLLDCKNELEILQNNYEFYAPELESSTDFIDYYVGIYDYLLGERDGQNYCFGLESLNKELKINGLTKIKNQPKLSLIYSDAIKALASSDGRVTPDIIKINQKLDLGYKFQNDQRLSIDLVRNFIGDIINGIVSVIDKADDSLLLGLESHRVDSDANYSAISCFGGQARSAGETYNSNSCPEISRSEMYYNNSISEEQNVMLRAFNIWENLDLFGKPKIDICVTANCPSHGVSETLKNRTVVGGCGFCVECHKILQKNKSPEKIYSEEIKKQKVVETKNKKKLSKEKPDKSSSKDENKKKS